MTGRSSIATHRVRGRLGIGAGALLVAVLIGACSQGPRQDINEPSGNFPVQITQAVFPASQTISQHTTMMIKVRNAGKRPIPDVNVTVCNVTCEFPAPAGQGTTSVIFANNSGQSFLAHPELPVWVVDKPPGLCGYSCEAGGAGADATSYDNNWAAGQLFPGDTATFRWGVTAMSAGRHVVAYSIAAGLNGKAKAVLAGGGKPEGTFTVSISQKPAQSYVTDSGQIVNHASAAGGP